MGVRSKAHCGPFRPGIPAMGVAPHPAVPSPYHPCVPTMPTGAYSPHTPEIAHEGSPDRVLSLSVEGRNVDQLWNDSVGSNLFANS